MSSTFCSPDNRGCEQTRTSTHISSNEHQQFKYCIWRPTVSPLSNTAQEEQLNNCSCYCYFILHSISVVTAVLGEVGKAWCCTFAASKLFGKSLIDIGSITRGHFTSRLIILLALPII
ncbi:hypothetical protein KIL84_020130 [Mauremys mutica]|uniref:Uncharacterized protein n=1 Tax=Mauremys mutica TaxID=74926 RepID=A0A9D4BAX5_9SAUR|nr:hypothetical protein KIL84_020130 [Mauremys mutica]